MFKHITGRCHLKWLNYVRTKIYSNFDAHLLLFKVHRESGKPINIIKTHQKLVTTVTAFFLFLMKLKKNLVFVPDRVCIFQVAFFLFLMKLKKKLSVRTRQSLYFSVCYHLCRGIGQ